MRILLPVDGSINSQNAIRFVGKCLNKLGSDSVIELLNVQYLVPEVIVEKLGLEALNAYYEAEGQKVFDALKKDIDASGLRVEKKILVGEIGDVVLKEAKEFKADMIIMGTHGRTAIGGLLLGSVSTKVLASANIPTLLVREKTANVEGDLRIGLCIDDSDYAKAAANLLARQKKFLGKIADISVIHVKAIDAVDAQEVFNPVLAILQKANIPAKPVTLVGSAADAICDFARDNLDLLVMGSHGYGNFKSVVLGSTATLITAKTDLPVLIVKA